MIAGIAFDRAKLRDPRLAVIDAKKGTAGCV
jgi:hypothetical protein